MTVVPVPTLEQWWAQGHHLPVRGRDGATYEVFVHDSGGHVVPEAALTPVALVHGYPGSSHDWAAVVGLLSEHRRVVATDLLGFGASEQADLVEQVWAALGLERVHVVAHDYGTIVAQELLARRSRAVAGVVLLNGAVYPHLHQPTPVQQALMADGGADLPAQITAEMFSAGLAATFGTAHPMTPVQGADMWAGLTRAGGNLLMADLLHYVADRRTHGQRWVDALETTDLPVSAVWGPQDPVSGAHVLAHLRNRLPRVPITELDAVGHWPLLEAPAPSQRTSRPQPEISEEAADVGLLATVVTIVRPYRHRELGQREAAQRDAGAPLSGPPAGAPACRRAAHRG